MCGHAIYICYLADYCMPADIILIREGIIVVINGDDYFGSHFAGLEVAYVAALDGIVGADYCASRGLSLRKRSCSRGVR